MTPDDGPPPAPNRMAIWAVGLLLMFLVFLLQGPQLVWTVRIGHSRGFQSGKASYSIVWSTLTLMANSAFLTAWCMLPRRRWLDAPLAAGLMLVVWLLLLPISLIMSGLLHGLAP
ncbi:MAG: hypothetical protein IBJ10_06860 [Phycisphaerales bacterium]|nr:hypothetical protein [Phycisphaerales bacterium]